MFIFTADNRALKEMIHPLATLLGAPVLLPEVPTAAHPR